MRILTVHPEFSFVLVIFTALALALIAICDIKTKKIRVLPFLLIPMGFAADGGFPQLADPLPYVVSAAIFGVLYLLAALYAGGGGGDAVLMSILALLYGFEPMMHIVLYAGGAMIGFALSKFAMESCEGEKSKTEIFKETCRAEIPYAPCVFIGYAAHAISMLVSA
jgi:Flp pilus assembly protein protease CpaA